MTTEVSHESVSICFDRLRNGMRKRANVDSGQFKAKAICFTKMAKPALTELQLLEGRLCCSAFNL